MDLSIAKHYSKLSIVCDSPIGKVTFLENYIPTTLVEQFADKILTGFSEHYKTESCVTEIIKQPFGEKKIEPTIDFQLNAYAHSRKADLYRRSNPWTTSHSSPLGSTIATTGIALCGGVFVYQSIQAIAQLKRNPRQALKHGMIAIFSVVLLLIFERVVLRM